MKKNWIAAGLCMLLAGAVWGADYTWTGANDGVWEDGVNWIDNGTSLPGAGGAYPGWDGAAATANDTAVIPDVSGGSGNDPVLNSGLTLSTLELEAGGVLDLNGNSLNAASLVLAGALNGASGDLTVAENLNVSGIASAAGTLLQYGPAGGPAVPVTVSAGGDISMGAALTLNGNITSSGGQTYTGAVDFGAGLTITLETGGNLTFQDDVDVTADILLGSLTVVFQGDVTVRTGQRLRSFLSGFVAVQADGKNLTLEGESAPGADDGAVLNTAAGSWRMGSGADAGFSGYDGTLDLGAGARLVCIDLNLTGASFSVDNAVPAPAAVWPCISAGGDVVIGAGVTFQAANLPYLVLEMTGEDKTLTTGQPIGSLTVRPVSFTPGAKALLQNDIILLGAVKIIYSESPPGGPYGIFDAGSHDVELRAGLSGTRDLGTNRQGGTDAVNYARFEVSGASSTAPPAAMLAFTQAAGNKVTFAQDPSASPAPVFFEIVGTTTWQDFVCEEAGAVIQFSQYPDQHVFFGSFTVKTGGAVPQLVPAADYITITRYGTGGGGGSPNTYYKYYDPANPGLVLPPPGDSAGDIPNDPAPPDLKSDSVERGKFWNFNLHQAQPGIPSLDLQCVNVYFSHAWLRQVTVNGRRLMVKAAPFYAPPGGPGYFNYDWLEPGGKIVYSFTEDGNGNGKIDRIRVQTSTFLNGDFSGFDALVRGYAIDRTRGTAYPGYPNGCGFELVSDITSDPNDDDSFYIYLEEQPWLDGGEVPLWDLIRNTSLGRNTPQLSPLGDPAVDRGIKTFDTIPPRAAHALSLPEKAEAYIRFSEPVVPETPGTQANVSFAGSARFLSVREAGSSAPRGFSWDYLPLGGPPRSFPLTVPAGTFAYLLSLTGPYTLSELAGLPDITSGDPSGDGYFEVENMMDLGVRALDWNDPAVDPLEYRSYPSPKYPVDWNYSAYLTFEGNEHIANNPGGFTPAPGESWKTDDDLSTVQVLLPPNRMLSGADLRDLAAGSTVAPASPGHPVYSAAPYTNTGAAVASNVLTRRVTDLLVSIPPKNIQDTDTWFVWPLWARLDDSSLAVSDPESGLLPGSNENTFNTSEIIWDFTGKKTFENLFDIKLQAVLNTGAGISGAPGLVFADGISDRYKVLSSRGPAGLWLPAVLAYSDTFVTFGPPFAGSGSFSSSPPAASGSSAAGDLYNYSFTRPSGANPFEREFFFSVSGGWLAARLEGGAEGDWYNRIRPFRFGFHSITRQRNNATILNNVINPGKGERAYLDYTLNSGGPVTIQVFTMDGNLVRVLERRSQGAGNYRVSWDGKNSGGRTVARGMYFVRIVAPGIDEIRKVMVVK